MLSTAVAVVAYYVIMYAADAAGVPPNVSIGLQVRPRARELRKGRKTRIREEGSKSRIGLLGPVCAWVGACLRKCVSASLRLCVFVIYLPLHLF